MTENNPDFSNLYLVNNDSLTSLRNDEKYFSTDYLKSTSEKPKGFYIVYKNKAYKIKSQKSADRILGKIENMDANRFVELDRDFSKKKYGINRKYRTLEYK